MDRYVSFESLPQVRNPRGGYVHNENDSPYYTNMRSAIKIDNLYPNMEPPVCVSAASTRSS